MLATSSLADIWGQELRLEVIDSGAVFVVRTDSGDPTSVVLDTASCLDKAFGSTLNASRYCVAAPTTKGVRHAYGSWFGRHST